MDDITSFTALSDWYETPAGKQLYHYESKQLAQFLPNCFGSEIVQIGGASNLDWLASSSIKQKILLNLSADINMTKEMVLAHPFFLPFAPNSLDVIFMPHTLECTHEPRTLLNAACQVLSPGGFIIILGVNSLSLWAFQHKYRVLTKHKPFFPWVTKFLSINCIEKMLSENQCVIDSTRIGCYQTIKYSASSLFDEQSLMNILGPFLWSPLGAEYVILARKETTHLTPMLMEKRVHYNYTDNRVGCI